MRKPLFLALAAVVWTVAGTHAQEEHHLGATVTVQGTTVRATAGKGFGASLPQVAEISLEVSCSTADCREVRAIADSSGKRQQLWTRKEATDTKAVFTGNRNALAATDSLILSYGGKDLPGIPMAKQDDQTRVADNTTSLSGAPLLLCASEGKDTLAARSDAGLPVFVVGPMANVLYRTRPYIRENESAVVFVRGPRSVVRQIAVRRSSDFQQIGDFPLVGEGVSVPDDLVEFAAGTVADDPCVLSETRVDNFAGGKAGQVELSYATLSAEGKAERNVTGTFDFAVRRLFRGALSLGVIRTDLQAPAYSVAEGDSILLESGAGRRYGYALFLTPFIWGRRDVEEWSLARLPMYITPSVGVGLEKVGENALIGATLELPAGLFFTAGWHAGKVNRPVGGLEPGMVVPAGRRQEPSESRWDHDMFYSVSINLAAAGKFLSALGGK